MGMLTEKQKDTLGDIVVILILVVIPLTTILTLSIINRSTLPERYDCPEGTVLVSANGASPFCAFEATPK